MFGSILDKATGLLDKRFVLNLLLPALAFWAGIVLLAIQGSGWAPVAVRWDHLSGVAQVLVAGAAVAGLILFAFVIGGQVTALTKLWEGYWPGPLGRRLAGRGTARQLKGWRGLDTRTASGYTKRYYRYPVREAELLPTRLGNVLRAAEAYPGDDERYGLDAVFFWPRLYLVLPTEVRTQVEEYRSGVDRMVVLASLAVAFPVVALAPVGLAGTGWRAWLLGCVVALLVAVLTYRAAVSAAVGFGDVVRACFDLYRHTLLTQMGLAMPATLEEERQLWLALQQQLYRRGADEPELLRLRAEGTPRPAPPS